MSTLISTSLITVDEQRTSNNFLSVFNRPEKTNVLQLGAVNRKLLGLSAGSNDKVVVLDRSSVVGGHGLCVCIDGSDAL